jgi:hypothetical protein
MAVRDEDNDGTVPAAHAPQAAEGRWGATRRLQFIDFRLQWEGRINRNDLKAYFGITVQQATLDIGRYHELSSQRNLAYDARTKAFVKQETFRPIYARSSSERYLNDVFALATGVTDQSSSFIGKPPDVGIVQMPRRRLDEDTLAKLLDAIREKRVLRVAYQGMGRAESTIRDLSPHALAQDGFRWHLRAYCHLRGGYQDFVIARIKELSEASEVRYMPGDLDVQWRNTLMLMLGPNPNLSVEKRAVIEMDYGMTNGKVEYQCRQALLFYVLDHLKLWDEHPDPVKSHIILLNRAAIRPYIDRLKRVG